MASPLALAIQKWEFNWIPSDHLELEDPILAYLPGIPAKKYRDKKVAKRGKHRMIKTNIPLPLIFKDALGKARDDEFPYFNLLKKRNKTAQDIRILEQFYYSKKKNKNDFSVGCIPRIRVYTAFSDDADEKPNKDTKWYELGEIPTTLGMASQIYLQRYGNPIKIEQSGKIQSVFKYASESGKIGEMSKVPVLGQKEPGLATLYYQDEKGEYIPINWKYINDKDTADLVLNLMGDYLIEKFDTKVGLHADWFKLTSLTRVGYYLSFLHNLNRVFEGLIFNENFADATIKLRNALSIWKEKDFNAKELKSSESYSKVLKKWNSLISSWDNEPMAAEYLACFVFALGRKYLSMAKGEIYYPIYAYFSSLGILIGQYYPGYGSGLSLDLSGLMRASFGGR